MSAVLAITNQEVVSDSFNPISAVHHNKRVSRLLVGFLPVIVTITLGISITTGLATTTTSPSRIGRVRLRN